MHPKYRRKAIYKEIRADIGRILSDLCKRKGIEIIRYRNSGTSGNPGRMEATGQASIFSH